MTTKQKTAYNFAVNPKILKIFNKLTEGKDLDKIVDKVNEYVKLGKSLERAMADALEDFKLLGEV